MLTLSELERRAYIENDVATLRGIYLAQEETQDMFDAEHEEELNEMHDKMQNKIDAIRDSLNAALKEAA